MRDYHRILEISTDATEAQIRAQYKRLVRIYHPDRFTNPQDKAYVEQKLKDITDAYQALLTAKSAVQLSVPISTSVTPAAQEPTFTPRPVVLPAFLDFGKIVRGAQRSLYFQVQNEGGIASNLQLHYSDEQNWFKVTKGRRLHKTRPFPMEFAVVVDTSRLQAGKSYHGWIRLEMDEAITQLTLSASVLAQNPLVWLSPRIALAISMIALLVAIAGVQYFDLVLPIFSQTVHSFDPLQVAIHQPATADTLPSARSEDTVADVNAVAQGAQANTPSEAVLVDTLPPSVTPGDRTTVPGTIMIKPLSTTSVDPNGETRSLETNGAPLAGISGRVGAKPSTTKVLLLPPIESWAQTATPHSNRTALGLTPTIAVTSTVIPRRNEARGTPISAEPATYAHSIPLTRTATSTTVATITTAPSLTTPVSARTQGLTRVSTASVTPTDLPVATVTSTPTVASPISAWVPLTSPTSSSVVSSTVTPTPVSTQNATQTVLPTPTATPLPTQRATASPTATAIWTASPTATSTATSPATNTSTATATTTPTMMPTLTPSITPSATPTATPSRSPTYSPTPTPMPTLTPTLTPTATPTAHATRTLTPSPTATATQVASPVIPTTIAGIAIVLIPDNYNVNARAENSTNAAILQVLVSGSQWIAVGRTIDNTWVLIRLNGEQVGWVFVATVITDPEQVALLPIVVTNSY